MIENTDFTPPSDPWDLFREWFALAEKQEPNDPNAMSLATVDENGKPSVRIMLMKGVEHDAFTFFTNRQSRKGAELANGEAAICFYWKSLHRQIRAEGIITPVTDAESDAYFATRPRGSQIGAWASWQSQPLTSRPVLEQKIAELEKQYADKLVPRPHYWGGYRLTPMAIEFWQARDFRLHDRFQYRRRSPTDPWGIERLYP